MGMDLYNYLLKKYGYNEPIFTQEIAYKEYSKPWLYKELNRLCDKGALIRYDKGVYYIPKQTALGPSLLDPRKVIRKKYVQAGDTAVGYYSGNTLLNLLELSTQMPNSIEIFTNNEKSKVREIRIGNQSVVLRRARTPVTNENAAVLQFLELMNFTDAAFYNRDRRAIVDRFIKEKGITRDKVTAYAPVFPDRVMRNLIESEVVYSVAP